MTHILTMVLAAFIRTGQYKNLNGHPCIVTDVTPQPNVTRKTFHQVRRCG